MCTAGQNDTAYVPDKINAAAKPMRMLQVSGIFPSPDTKLRRNSAAASVHLFFLNAFHDAIP